MYHAKRELGSPQQSALPSQPSTKNYPSRLDLLTELPRGSRAAENQVMLTGPSPLPFNRVVQIPIALSDSFHLPTSTHLSMPRTGIAVNEKVGPGAHDLDPMRFCKQHQNAAETHPTNSRPQKKSLHFGYGKGAYPGKYSAMYEVKMILAYLLLMYDSNDGRRPRNHT